MAKEFFIIAVFSLLTGCSLSKELRPFFMPKVNCGNGWRAVNQTLCDLERSGY